METLDLHAKLFFGKDSLQHLNEVTGKKVWIVCDKFLAENGNIKQITERLDASNEITVWSDIVPDPPVKVISAGIECMDKIRPQFVLAFGGGSAIDTAKAVLYFSKRLFQINVEKFIAIPTTSGTGSEVTNAAVISDPVKRTKYPLFTPELLPNEAILDPQLVLSVPPSITANTGMDVFTHALESYVSTGSNDFTEALAEKSGRMVMKYLPVCCKDGRDVESRKKMHNASCMAGLAFNQANLGINHSIAHQLGAVFHMPHGLANAIMLNAVIRFNAEQSRKACSKYAQFARAIGAASYRDEDEDEKAVLCLQKSISSLMSELKVPATLTAVGIKKEDVSKALKTIVENVYKDACLPTNPVRPTPEQVVSLVCEVI